MFRVLTCLTVEHDWRLVGVAAVLCLFASLTAVNLFNRARATAGRARALWIIAAATATGFGIWATHFVAMLAYEPGIPIAYSLTRRGRMFAVEIPGRVTWDFPLVLASVFFGMALEMAVPFRSSIDRSKGASIGSAPMTILRSAFMPSAGTPRCPNRSGAASKSKQRSAHFEKVSLKFC